jgi:hypothetical protein
VFNVILRSDIKPNIVMQSIVMPGVIMPGVVMLSVVMLSVVIPIVMAPTEEVFCSPPISILIPSFFECKKCCYFALQD